VVLVVDDKDGTLLGSLTMESLLRSIQPTGAEQTGIGGGEGR